MAIVFISPKLGTIWDSRHRFLVRIGTHLCKANGGDFDDWAIYMYAYVHQGNTTSPSNRVCIILLTKHYIYPPCGHVSVGPFVAMTNIAD